MENESRESYMENYIEGLKRKIAWTESIYFTRRATGMETEGQRESIASLREDLAWAQAQLAEVRG